MSLPFQFHPRSADFIKDPETAKLQELRDRDLENFLARPAVAPASSSQIVDMVLVNNNFLSTANGSIYSVSHTFNVPADGTYMLVTNFSINSRASPGNGHWVNMLGFFAAAAPNTVDVPTCGSSVVGTTDAWLTGGAHEKYTGQLSASVSVAENVSSGSVTRYYGVSGASTDAGITSIVIILNAVSWLVKIPALPVL